MGMRDLHRSVMELFSFCLWVIGNKRLLVVSAVGVGAAPLFRPIQLLEGIHLHVIVSFPLSQCEGTARVIPCFMSSSQPLHSLHQSCKWIIRLIRAWQAKNSYKIVGSEINCAKFPLIGLDVLWSHDEEWKQLQMSGNIGRSSLI